MNTSAEAADQVVRMSLNGAEAALKITGSGAKEVAKLLFKALKDLSKQSKKTKGQMRLSNLVKSGKKLDIYQVSEGISKWLDVAFFQTELETQEISDFNDLNTIRQLLKEGKINEFYAGVKRMTEQMKEQYRKYNE